MTQTIGIPNQFFPDIGFCTIGKERGTNEDYVLYDEQTGICVADGIGQAPLADAVARCACHAAMHALREGESASAAIASAQDRVLRFISDVESPGSGTSIVVISLNGQELDATWAGDTALFVLDPEGSDCSLISNLDTSRFAVVPPLGKGYHGVPGTYRTPLETVDSIAICTNGAWRSAGIKTIGMLLAQRAAARRTAARIVLGRQTHDDSTALVVRLKAQQMPLLASQQQGRCMIGATAKYVTSDGYARQNPGSIDDPSGAWHFAYDPAQAPIVSSKRKHIYRGTFAEESQHDSVPACAVAFEPKAIAAFGNECANLGLLTSLGVGPKLLAIACHQFEGTGTSFPVVIEQDAGENLALLLQSSKSPRGTKPILHANGTSEREIENLKILYDIYAQMLNAHRAGIYHRDLRCENVCVRRFGKNPADIRATIIDFELSATLDSGEPRAHSPLFHTLFEEIPSYMAGEHLAIAPNPLELDMGYLAALQYHVTRGNLLLNGARHSGERIEDFVAFLKESVRYFGYAPIDAPPYARHLSQPIDIDRIATTLGLAPVNETSFPSRNLLEHAMSYHRPYLDGEEMESCMSGPEARIANMVDRMVTAKYESYKALRRAQGLEVIYERMEDQPEDLKRSNYAQAEHIVQKVRALGYRLEPKEEGLDYDEVTAFTDEQIEALARLEHDRWTRERFDAGWTLDPQSTASNAQRKTSPYLVPYDELSYEIQEYDRDAARQLISLIQFAGLVVVRPKS